MGIAIAPGNEAPMSWFDEETMSRAMSTTSESDFLRLSMDAAARWTRTAINKTATSKKGNTTNETDKTARTPRTETARTQLKDRLVSIRTAQPPALQDEPPLVKQPTSSTRAQPTNNNNNNNNNNRDDIKFWRSERARKKIYQFL